MHGDALMIDTDRLNAFTASLALTRAVYGQRAKLEYEIGRTFARVFTRQGAFRSAVCFVCLETGDVYRADSWRKRGRLIQKAGA